MMSLSVGTVQCPQERHHLVGLGLVPWGLLAIPRMPCGSSGLKPHSSGLWKCTSMVERLFEKNGSWCFPLPVGRAPGWPSSHYPLLWERLDVSTAHFWHEAMCMCLKPKQYPFARWFLETKRILVQYVPRLDSPTQRCFCKQSPGPSLY